MAFRVRWPFNLFEPAMLEPPTSYYA
jgi:hypothetical protein